MNNEQPPNGTIQYGNIVAVRSGFQIKAIQEMVYRIDRAMHYLIQGREILANDELMKAKTSVQECFGVWTNCPMKYTFEKFIKENK